MKLKESMAPQNNRPTRKKAPKDILSSVASRRHKFMGNVVGGKSIKDLGVTVKFREAVTFSIAEYFNSKGLNDAVNAGYVKVIGSRISLLKDLEEYRRRLATVTKTEIPTLQDEDEEFIERVAEKTAQRTAEMIMAKLQNLSLPVTQQVVTVKEEKEETFSMIEPEGEIESGVQYVTNEENKVKGSIDAARSENVTEGIKESDLDRIRKMKKGK